MKFRTITLAAIAASLLAGPALAHHSFAMFEHDKKVTIEGTVKQFEWSNPHAWMHMVVMGKDGQPAEWSFEMGSIGQIAGQGWHPNTVKPGDKLTLVMHPLKDGSHGGQYVSATTPDGHVYREGQITVDENKNIPHD